MRSAITSYRILAMLDNSCGARERRVGVFFNIEIMIMNYYATDSLKRYVAQFNPETFL